MSPTNRRRSAVPQQSYHSDNLKPARSALLKMATTLLARKPILCLSLLTLCFYWQFFHDGQAASATSLATGPEESGGAVRSVISVKDSVSLPSGRYIVPERVNRHPQYPDWTDKFPLYPDEDEVENNRVCFVHVGKTAGSTLACSLGFQYPACGKSIEVLPGELAKHTTNIIHTRFDTCRRTEITTYLFALRDPLSRMQSWFTYERPENEESPEYELKKPLFIDCHFQTLNELGTALLDYHPNDTATTTCAQRAYDAVSGKVPSSRHNFFNYEYYYRQIPADGKIAVIRTEHLADDWNSLEVTLFQAPPLNATAGYFGKKNTSKKRQTDLVLSAKARVQLCQALCHEIRLYQHLLQTAVNLQPSDVQQSLRELHQSCPPPPGKQDYVCSPTKTDSE